MQSPSNPAAGACGGGSIGFNDRVLAVLPQQGFLRAYVEYARTQNKAPLFYHLAIGLSTLAAVLPQDLHFYDGGIVAPNLYTMIVGRSAVEQKSRSARISQGVMERAGLRSRIVPSASSVPGLMKGLLSTGGVGVLYEEEFSRQMGQAKIGGHLEEYKGMLMYLYDAPPSSDRQVRDADECVTVERPRLSVVAAIAGVLLEHGLSLSDLLGGFASRWLFACDYRREIIDETPAPERPALRDRAADLLQRRFHYCPLGAADQDSAGWDSDATARHLGRWAQQIDRALVSLNYEDVAATVPYARSHILAKKVALLLAVDAFVATTHDWRLDQTGQTVPTPQVVIPITLDAVLRAQLIADLSGESLRAFLDQMCSTQQGRDMRRIVGLIPVMPAKVSVGALCSKMSMALNTIRPLLATLREQGLAMDTMAPVNDGFGERVAEVWYRLAPQQYTATPPTQQVPVAASVAPAPMNGQGPQLEYDPEGGQD